MALRRDSRRTGLYPLAYLGVEPISPPLLITDNRAPTTQDYKNFNVGTLWVDRSTAPLEDVWMLVNKDSNVARWIMVSRDEDTIKTLTGNAGGAVGPDAAQNIDIIGAGPYVFTGNPAAFSLTLDDDGTIATQYDADAGSAIPVANILNVLGGTYVATAGAGNSLLIDIIDDIAASYVTDAGTAIPVANVLNVFGGELIGTVGITNNVTVNLDRGTDGQVIIAATGAISAYANITSVDNSVSVVEGPNTIDLAVQDPISGIGYYNIGLSVTTGPNIITIYSANGTAFSVTNRGVVSFASKAVPGTFVKVEITANVDMAWSDMDGNTMGTTGSMAWADIMPMYVYAVLNDAEDAVMFGLARIPHNSASGVTANIGTPAVTNANDDLSLFLFDSVTIADYDDNPVVILGSLKATKDAADAWTFVSPIVGGDTGIGGFQIGERFAQPLLQNGAQSTCLFAGGGVAGVPVFATAGCYYMVTLDGMINISSGMNELTVAGTTAATLYHILPLAGEFRSVGLYCLGDASVSVAAIRGVYRALLISAPLAGTGGHYGMQFVKNEIRRLQCSDFDTTNNQPSQISGNHQYWAHSNRLP